MERDLAISQPQTPTVTIMIGNWAGGFGPQRLRYAGPANAAMWAISITTQLDVVVAHTPSHISILLGNGLERWSRDSFGSAGGSSSLVLLILIWIRT